MKKNKEEFIEGDKRVQKTWLIGIGIYVIFLIWLEPVIDMILSLTPLETSASALEAFNQKKHYIATIAFSMARSLPILLFLWLGIQSLLQQRIPPRGLKLPFTVKLIKGPQARMGAMLMIAVSLLLLFREVTMMVSVAAGQM